MSYFPKTIVSVVRAQLANHPKLRPLSWLLVPVVVGISFLAISASSPPAIPPVNLASDPLYATAAGDKPVLALSLSVEFPTVGAQYVDVPNTNLDNSYTNSKEYLGYYDAESCYAYNDAPTETPVAPQTFSDYKRFDRVGAAVTRMCNTSFPNAFSGNFLNWSSNSAVDMMRLALTGGDRYVDTSSLTILQRAVIPNEDPICMWNSNNFPAKRLNRTGISNTGVSSGVAFFGAVPAVMQTTAGTNDIWIANTLDRIYFRAATTAAGGCSTNPSNTNHTLGVRPNWKGTSIAYTSKPPGWPSTAAVVRGADGKKSDGTSTGDGVNTIALAGVQEVLYGNGTDWVSMPASGVFTCSNVGFGGSNVNVSASCFVRAYTGTQTQPAAAVGTLTNYPFFYARAQVCNNTLGVLADVRNYGTGYDYCKQYPNGNFKPAGAIQKYSDQLRLAAFGYLMDQTASYNTGGRYGGVLRAPVKYVGAKTFDINGVENTPTGGNVNQEWDVTTGVFNLNPDNDTTFGKSGVITYLNQFGRTGSTPGLYKKYDPIGELHFETVRYLQGLQPSTFATSGITPAMYDGFPVSTTWVDPYGGGRSNTDDYSCLKSNIVVIGDINTHDGNRFPGTADPANNIPKIVDWRDTVLLLEAATTGNYLDGAGVSRPTAGQNPTPNSAAPSSASRSMIMGSAYWARTHDIRGTNWTGTGGLAKQRPGLRVKTFTFDVNEYGTSGPVATRRTSNQLFMAAKYGGFETSANNGNLTNPLAFNTQGNPFKRDDGTADKYVWEDTDPATSRVGEANTYFLQSDARGVLKAFDDIFARSSTSARSIAGAAVQSKSLTTQVGNAIYQGTFDTGDWSGDLLAIPVTVNGSNTVSISTTPTWTASPILTARNLTAAPRNIVVGNAGATANPVAAPFSWALPAGSAGIEANLRVALDKITPTAVADGLAQDRLNYLRGDRSREASSNGPFRTRTKLLGDIVNSGVAYSGAPSQGINANGYASFYSTNAARTKAVFVGANDGMLHAFDAGSSSTGGQELFAYVPSWLGPKLSALTVPTYASNHQSYVDGTPVVAEADVGSGSPSWKTVLVGGTGAGGKGVFALDITNPSTFSSNNVMWEFTDIDDADMGNVIGRAQILKMRTSGPTGAATYKWFAVVPGGVNSYVGTSAPYGSGYPTLFLLDLAKSAGTAWQLGTNYYKIALPVNGNLNYLTSGTLTAATATGLINFKAAIGSAGEVVQMYMGDLHGNMWKLDFSINAIGDWNMGKLSPFQTGTAPSTTPLPMFIAKDTAGNKQPITMSPSIAFGPVANSSYVLFGTGKFLELADKTNNATQSAYMVYDTGYANLDALIGTRESAVSGRVRLKRGTVTVSSGTVAVPGFTLGRGTTALDSEVVRSGWYFDFPTSGERQISNASIVGNKALFGSLIPAVTATSGTCNVSSGGGYAYVVDMSGNGTALASTVGILGEPIPFETGSAAYGPTDSTGRRTKTITTTTGLQGSSGVAVAGSSGTFTTTVTAGRLSWRQIHNYLDLKAAP